RSVVAASERYNTRIETLLRDRLGVTFSPVQRDDGLREVREIDGVNPALISGWSKRRSMIETRRAELAAEFLTRHGRAPTPNEVVKLAQQATIETRQSKHAPKSEAEQREQWRAEAATILGDQQAVDATVWSALAPDAREPKALTSPQDAARSVIDRLQSERSTWQVMHVRAEAERLARAHDIDPDNVDRWVEDVVGQALGAHDVRRFRQRIELNEPQTLRRNDGESVYATPKAAQYTSRAVEDAETRILDHAKTLGYRKVAPETVDVALLEHVANGKPLNDGQRALVREVTTSGQALQLVLAPAGAGKTTAMRVVADAWRDDGGTVIGLAPSASAGALLAEEMDAVGDTLAKLVGGIRGTNPMPDWAETVNDSSLIVIDEAGLAGTLDLETATTWLTERRASVRLVGDDRQLAAIGSGGTLRDIAREVGAVSLREVVRFIDPAEAATTLAVREGDAAAAAWWADHGRIHAGAVDAQTDDVVAAWWADTQQGRDSLMLASTREQVRALNQAARARRVTAGDVDTSRTTTARGDVQIGIGDQILARRNDRRIHITPTHWLKNGDRFTVTAIGDAGDITAHHAATGRTLTLPHDYVAAHIDLGYASTIHGAQGVTVDTSHTLITGNEDRQGLYVATSRGRHSNHLWVAVSTDGSDHSVVRPEAIAPQTALEIVEDVIRHDGSAVSARTARAAAADPRALAPLHIAAYEDARGVAIVSATDPATLARIDTEADTIVPGITATGGWEVLRVRLAEISLGGATDPLSVLAEAAAKRELDTARDTGAVMWWRLSDYVAQPGSHDPALVSLSGIPAALLADETWGPYLSARRTQVHADVAAVRDQLRHDLATTQPRWSAGLSHQRALVERIAIWRVLHNVPDDDMRPLGAQRVGAREQKELERLEKRIEAALEQSQRTTDHWRGIAHALDPRVTDDPYWRVIAATLTRLDHSGIDAETTLRTAMGRPLPAERPGTALWWRICNATTPDTSIDGPTRLRPAWVATVEDVLTDGTLDSVIASPDWPVLVERIEQHGGTDVAATAAYLLTQAQAAHPDDPAALATAAVLHADVLQAEDTLHIEDTSRQPSPADDAWYCATITPRHHARPAFRPVVDEPWEPETPTPADPFAARPLPPLDQTQVDAVIEANEAALDYWRSQHPDSPAEGALRARFGAVVNDIDAGYAPASWTGLVDHLRALGFSDAQLVDADLARYSRRGTLIDTYRDRLMLPVRDGAGAVVGFTGRRLDDTDTRAPKWMNGGNTAAWAKSTTLYGIDNLTAAATPVLVEGAMDALAVTLATNGEYVGLAPLGTALTAAQLDRLRDHRDVIVAFDPDAPGRRAAEAAYTQLAQRHVSPATIDLPEGVDPASLLTDHGPEALRAALEDAHPLVETLLAQVLEDLTETVYAQNERLTAVGAVPLTEPEIPDLYAAVKRASAHIAAADPDEWTTLIRALAQQMHTDEQVLWLAVTEAATNYVPAQPEDVDLVDQRARAQAALERIALRHGVDPKTLTPNPQPAADALDEPPSYTADDYRSSIVEDGPGSVKL
ncbi:MAG: AAA family ATPase, partial [Propionibacteriaceae bacterium]|nr:AAA family ATPase [Propionibacteriaceae bacterium]